MIEDNRGPETPSDDSRHKEVKVYQRVTGNEGPSPLMKRYLKSRLKKQSAQQTGSKPVKTC